MDEKVVLRLSRAEALALFEWLARLDGAGVFPFDHEAEQRVLWNVEGQLEKALWEVFDPAYAARLEDARQQILDREGPSG